MNGSKCNLVNGTPGTQLSLEQNELKSIVEQNEKIIDNNMPNYYKAITPKEKFINYSLDYDNKNSRGKAEAYEKSLGFTKNNADILITQIETAIKSGQIKPYEISKSNYGTKYKFRLTVQGSNGKIKNIIVVYQIDNGENTPRLITNYVEGQK